MRRTSRSLSLISARVATGARANWLGVPDEDWERMFTLTNRVLGADDPEYQTVAGDARETANQGVREMFDYFGRLVTVRRAAPRDDLLSVLTAAEIDGEALTTEEILYFCYLLIVAGNGTLSKAVTRPVLSVTTSGRLMPTRSHSCLSSLTAPKSNWICVT